MMKVNYNSNTLAFQKSYNESFVSINLTNKIIGFCINEKYIAIIEDWEHLQVSENLYIYDLNGKLLFNVKSAPKALYNDGFYSSIGFKNNHILIAQSNDFRYEIDLENGRFLNSEFTK